MKGFGPFAIDHMQHTIDEEDMKKICIGFALLATLSIATGVNAGTLYTSRATFEAALSSFSTETFESYPTVGNTGSGGVNNLAFAEFSVTSVSPSNSLKLLDAPAFGAQNTTPLGSKYLYIDTDVGFSGFSVQFDPDNARNAIGFDYSGNNNAGNSNTVTVDGSVFNVANAVPGGSFFGYIADPGDSFTSLNFSASQNSAMGVDELTLGIGGEVPEPASFALWAIGVVGFCARRARS